MRSLVAGGVVKTRRVWRDVRRAGTVRQRRTRVAGTPPAPRPFSSHDGFVLVIRSYLGVTRTRIPRCRPAVEPRGVSASRAGTVRQRPPAAGRARPRRGTRPRRCWCRRPARVPRCVRRSRSGPPLPGHDRPGVSSCARGQGAAAPACHGRAGRATCHPGRSGGGRAQHAARSRGTCVGRLSSAEFGAGAASGAAVGVTAVRGRAT